MVGFVYGYRNRGESPTRGMRMPRRSDSQICGCTWKRPRARASKPFARLLRDEGVGFAFMLLKNLLVGVFAHVFAINVCRILQQTDPLKAHLFIEPYAGFIVSTHRKVDVAETGLFGLL